MKGSVKIVAFILICLLQKGGALKLEFDKSSEINREMVDPNVQIKPDILNFTEIWARAPNDTVARILRETHQTIIQSTVAHSKILYPDNLLDCSYTQEEIGEYFLIPTIKDCSHYNKPAAFNLPVYLFTFRKDPIEVPAIFVQKIRTTVCTHTDFFDSTTLLRQFDSFFVPDNILAMNIAQRLINNSIEELPDQIEFGEDLLYLNKVTKSYSSRNIFEVLPKKWLGFQYCDFKDNIIIQFGKIEALNSETLE